MRETTTCKFCACQTIFTETAVCENCYNVSVGWAICPADVMVNILKAERPDVLTWITKGPPPKKKPHRLKRNG